MGKLDQLKGVANNLADSFVSVTNRDFLWYIESLPLEQTKLFEIDLLNETIIPKELDSAKVEEAIKKYKKWFIAEIKKLKIELSEIEIVSVKIAYKSGKSFAKYYTCNVTIKTKNKEYVKKVMSSYS